MLETVIIRPIRITFCSEEECNEVLKAFHKTRKENKPDSLCVKLKIAMRKDMTPLERKSEEALYKELKLRKQESEKAGDENARWVRKNGKIINLSAPPVPPPQAEGTGG